MPTQYIITRSDMEQRLVPDSQSFQGNSLPVGARADDVEEGLYGRPLGWVVPCEYGAPGTTNGQRGRRDMVQWVVCLCTVYVKKYVNIRVNLYANSKCYTGGQIVWGRTCFCRRELSNRSK